MSLSIARFAAYSAMMATETQISVSSANIANADTDGYTKKIATQVSTASNGTVTGTAVTGISGAVDSLLLKSLIQAGSALGAASATNDYAGRLQSLFGSTDSGGAGTSLANTLASLETAVSQLADTPESSTLKAQVVNAIDDLASQLRETSSQIATLRSGADQQIGSDVDSANNLLASIKDLNTQITQAAAAGNSTADLEDKRNSALQNLAGLMNINYFTGSGGTVQIYTSSGQVLLDSSVHPLAFQTASSAASGGSGALGGISVGGTDITSQITSGAIGGLLEQRDVALPGAQKQLDNLAVTLAGALNNVSNAGAASPPRSSLTGTRLVSTTDALSASGTVRLAVTDAKGNLQNYQDLDLSNYATVGDFLTAVNGISGLSASIDTNGHLVIAATAGGSGVAVNQMDSSIGGSSLPAWFGLNDVVTATGAADFSVRSALLNDSSLLPSSELDSSASLNAGSNVVAPGSSKTVQALYGVLTGNQNFGAAGGLSARASSFAAYAADVVTSAATAARQAGDKLTTKQTVQSNIASAISSASGVNIDEETARISQLQNDYAAAAQVMQIINTMFAALLTSVQAA